MFEQKAIRPTFISCILILGNVLICEALVDCGGYIDGSMIQSGTITSPNYPLYYQNNSNCIWLIQAPPNNTISFTLLYGIQSEVSSDGNCVDFIEMRAGNSSASLLYMSCTDTGPVTTVSPNRWLWIQFFSSDFTDGPGFIAEWSDIPVANQPVLPSAIAACPSVKFRCSNYECVSLVYTCDSYNDCGCLHGCDEDGCHTYTMDYTIKLAIGVSIGTGLFVIAIVVVIAWECILSYKRRASEQRIQYLASKNRNRQSSMLRDIPLSADTRRSSIFDMLSLQSSVTRQPTPSSLSRRASGFTRVPSNASSQHVQSGNPETKEDISGKFLEISRSKTLCRPTSANVTKR